MKTGDKIFLTIRDIGVNGEGIGSYLGMTFFVFGALPKEKVVAEIVEIKKNFGKAKLLHIEQSSPHRIRPICPSFTRCGGCQLMHLSYIEQLALKQKRVQDNLERIGKIPFPVLPCLPSHDSWNYRNKIQLPVTFQNGKAEVGLYAFHSHEIIPTSQCFIHCPLGEKVLQVLKGLIQEEKNLRYLLIRTAIHTQEVLIGLIERAPPSSMTLMLGREIQTRCPEVVGVVHKENGQENNVIVAGKETTIVGRNYLNERLGVLQYKVSFGSFFQVNPLTAENILNQALDLAEIQPTDTVLDAYCGVGTFALLAAKEAKKVWGMEISPVAIEDAKANAKKNNLNNVHFSCQSAEEGMKKANVVFLNPPRKGCHEKVLAETIQIQPRVILYMSCNPATLARDLSYFQTNGYQADYIQPFDMFPQTMHVETLARIIPVQSLKHKN